MNSLRTLKMFLMGAGVATALGLGAAVPAKAAVVASTYSGGGTETTFQFALGWFFTPNADMVVTGLGVLDLGDPGLSESHDIGIFTVADVPIVTSSVGAGACGDIQAGSCFVGVAPTLLSAGQSYYITGTNWTSDLFAFGDAQVSYAPEITWDGEGGADANSIFAGLTNFDRQHGNLGPNFRFDVPVSVPEPSSLAILGLSLAGLAFLRRRRAA